MRRAATAPASARVWLFLESRLTLDLLWTLVVPVALLVSLNLKVVHPNDFWWHLRMGEIVLEEGRVPTTDRFSFTHHGEAWVDQNWLMQVFMFAVYRLGGLPLNIAAHALMVTAGYCWLLVALKREYGLRPAALATFMGAVVGLPSWTVRPQGFSFLAFGALMSLAAGHRRGHRRLLWLAVPLIALWSNCHGVFLYGLLVLGLYCLSLVATALRRAGGMREALPWQVVGVVVLSVLALVLNPLGPRGAIEYVAGFLDPGDVTTRLTSEWQPLTVRTPSGALFFVSVGLLLLLLTRSRFRPALDQGLSLLVFGGLALWAQRNGAWYGFVMAPVVAACLARLWWRRPVRAKGRVWANGLLTAALLAGVALSWPGWRARVMPEGRRDLLTPGTPTAAVEFLCEVAPEGTRVFAEQGFASYLIWACPGRPVFVDTRIDLYLEDDWAEYHAISGARFDWEELVGRHSIGVLLLRLGTQQHLVRAASASANWAELYRDDRAAVFARAEAGTE